MKKIEERKKFILMSNMGNGAKCYLEKLKPYIKTMAYIPSRSDFGQTYYRRVVEIYSDFIEKFKYCDLEKDNSEDTINHMLCSDVIFIAGGDECFILKTMLTNGLKEKFRNYMAQGGIIIGLCAGAEVISQDIILVEETKKKNRVVALGYGLGLIDFVVYPRYDTSVSKNAILEYCESVKKKIILMGLDSFVVLDGEDIVKKGDVEIIYF